MRGTQPRLEALELRALFSTFHVTTGDDGVAGSLRDAIAQANANPGADVIVVQTPTVTLNSTGAAQDVDQSADLDVTDVPGGPVRAVFIRAPWVESVGEGVQVLARVPPLTLTGVDAGVAAFAAHYLTTEPPIYRTRDGAELTSVSAGVAGWSEEIVQMGRDVKEGRLIRSGAWLLFPTPTVADPSRAPQW